MDLLSLCSLPVGVVRWQATAPTMTFVVKATFSLERDGAAPLAQQQEPLYGDQPGAQGASDELGVASDFVPLKPKVDVLLTGHAWAETPTQVMTARLNVNALDKRFFAIAGRPSTSIPLADAYLRAGPSWDAAMTHVRPRAPWSSCRQRFANPRLVSRQGIPIAPLASNFDFRYFNAAPPDQQMDTSPSDALLVLEGLLYRAAVRRVRLYGYAPRLFWLPRGQDPEHATPTEITLRCDTLWIDTDRALCTLTWRGLMACSDEPARLVVVLDTHRKARTWDSIRCDFGRATRGRVVEAPLLSAGPVGFVAPSARAEIAAKGSTANKRTHLSPEQVSEIQAQIQASRQQQPPSVATTLAPPLVVELRPALPFDPGAETQKQEPSVNVTLPPLARPPRPALPFETSADPKTQKLHGEATIAPPLVADHRAALPFGSIRNASASKGWNPEIQTIRAPVMQPSSDMDETIPPFANNGNHGEQRVLPFQRIAVTAEPDPQLDVTPCDMAMGVTLLPIPRQTAALPFGAPNPAPIDADPRPTQPQQPQIRQTTPLEEYARIKMALWCGSVDRCKILEDHGISELDWELTEDQQHEELAQEAKEGRDDKALALVLALDAVARERIVPVAQNGASQDALGKG